MGVEGASFGLEARSLAVRLDPGGKRRGRLSARSKPHPDDPRHSSPFEEAQRPEPQLERVKPIGFDCAGDALGQRAIDMAQKANGQMKVARRDPTKLRSCGSAC